MKRTCVKVQNGKWLKRWHTVSVFTDITDHLKKFNASRKESKYLLTDGSMKLLGKKKNEYKKMHKILHILWRN